VPRKLSERPQRVPARRPRPISRQTLVGAIVGAIVAVALMLFSAPAEAGRPNDWVRAVEPSLTR
jgi:hypothetical protein